MITQKCQPVQVGPEVIAKKGLLPMIEVNLDLVDNQIRFQPQVSKLHHVVPLVRYVENYCSSF